MYIGYACRADKNPYRHDRRADKNSYRHDRRADKNPYRHDRRADSQCRCKVNPTHSESLILYKFWIKYASLQHVRLIFI